MTTHTRDLKNELRIHIPDEGGKFDAIYLFPSDKCPKDAITAALAAWNIPGVTSVNGADVPMISKKPAGEAVRISVAASEVPEGETPSRPVRVAAVEKLLDQISGINTQYTNVRDALHDLGHQAAPILAGLRETGFSGTELADMFGVADIQEGDSSFAASEKKPGGHIAALAHPRTKALDADTLDAALDTALTGIPAESPVRGELDTFHTAALGLAAGQKTVQELTDLARAASAETTLAAADQPSFNAALHDYHAAVCETLGVRNNFGFVRSATGT